MLELSQKNSGEVEELRILYRKETLQRKLLYNQVLMHCIAHHVLIVVSVATRVEGKHQGILSMQKR